VSDNHVVEGTGVSKSELLLQFWAYRRQFLGRIYCVVHNPAAIEDIFQEACLKLLNSKAVFPHPQAGTRYFCKILNSLAMEHLNRGMRLVYQNRLPDIALDPWANHDRQQLTERVCEHAHSLPLSDRVLLNAYLSPRTAGKRPKIPPSTRHYRVSKVLRKLRTMIGE
jgi:DNA-directed RNA polymerase specialized sigma24 family protein